MVISINPSFQGYRCWIAIVEVRSSQIYILFCIISWKDTAFSFTEWIGNLIIWCDTSILVPFRNSPLLMKFHQACTIFFVLLIVVFFSMARFLSKDFGGSTSLPENAHLLRVLISIVSCLQSELNLTDKPNGAGFSSHTFGPINNKNPNIWDMEISAFSMIEDALSKIASSLSEDLWQSIVEVSILCFLRSGWLSHIIERCNHSKYRSKEICSCLVSGMQTALLVLPPLVQDLCCTVVIWWYTLPILTTQPLADAFYAFVLLLEVYGVSIHFLFVKSPLLHFVGFEEGDGFFDSKELYHRE